MIKISKISIIVLVFYLLFYHEARGGNQLILYSFAAIAVLSVLIHCVCAGYLAYDRVPYGIWNNLILTVYAVTVGFFVAADFMTTIRSSITLLSFALIAFVICYISAEEGSFEWILKLLIAIALLCSFYTFFFGVEWPGYGIVLSATNNPHNLAAVLNLGVFSTIYLFRNREKKFSFISVALIFLFSIVTIRCGSRKYLIANTLIEGIWAWTIMREGWKSGDSNKKIITVVVIIVFSVAAYYIIQNVYLGSDSHQRMQNNSNDLGNIHRLLFYEEAWKIFLNHPIFGGGLNQFRNLSTVATGMYAHSTYAEAIADLGFVGCVLYFAPIVAVTYRILKRALNSKNIYSDYLLLAFCLSELFIGTVQIFFMEFHHFLVWAILFYYDQTVMESKSEKISTQKNIRMCKYIR